MPGGCPEKLDRIPYATVDELKNLRNRERHVLCTEDFFAQAEERQEQNELNGAVYEDLVLLKDIYVRYQDQLHRRELGPS